MLSCKLDLLDFVNHLYSKVNTLERKKSKLCRQSRYYFLIIVEKKTDFAKHSIDVIPYIK